MVAPMTRWLIPLAIAAQGGVAIAAERVELPVRLVVLSDGTRRFGVPLTVAGQAIEAGLDTGSTGLRIMARGLPGSSGGGERVRYGYGSGTQLEGPLVTAPVTLGAAAGAIRVQRVDGLSCVAARPQCPVRRNGDVATFGIQGNGLAGQGFVAILGVNLRAASAPNPFEALGVRRWIIDLPRPSDARPGRIVLNPTAADMAGFTSYRLLGDDDSLAGCLAGPPPLGKLCGPATLDSGAPGLRVVEAERHAPVPDGTPVTLALGDGQQMAQVQLETGRRDQASRLSVEQQADLAQPRLFFGIAPYWRWSVLYDADAHTIGLRPR